MRMIIEPMEKSRETMRIATPYPIPPGPMSGLSNSSAPPSRFTASSLNIPDPTWLPTPAVPTLAAGSWQHNAQPINPFSMQKLGFHLIQPDDSPMGQAGKFAVVARGLVPGARGVGVHPFRNVPR